MKNGILQLESILYQTEAMFVSHFGDHTLDSISGAGKIHRPRIALVFINPTHRNISTRKAWKGLKAPWIGCNNIWKLFADAGLIEHELYKEMLTYGTDWTEEFSTHVYEHVYEKGLYITNIVKWAGLDAALPEKNKVKLYLPLLLDELRILKADKVVLFGQLTYDAVIKGLGISAPSYKELNESMLASNAYLGVGTDYGTLIPCYFPVGQGIKNIHKAQQILEFVNISR